MAESRDERSEQEEAEQPDSGGEQHRADDDAGQERVERAGTTGWGKAEDSAPAGSRDDDESSDRDEQREALADDEERGKPEVEPRELSQDELIGMQVVDSHGDKVGKIEALFIHQQDERASWARVKSGIGPLGSHSFIPLHDAQDDDGQIRIVYEREHVEDAPEIEPEGNEISDEEADRLHTHYGLERVSGLATETKDEDIELSREARDAQPPTMEEPPWAVEKYPLPDMDREPESERDDDGGDQEDEKGDEREDEEPRDEQEGQDGKEHEGRGRESEGPNS